MKILIFKDSAGEYRWRLRARNGKIVASSAESFKRLRTVIHSARKYTPRKAQILNTMTGNIVARLVLLFMTLSASAAPITGFQVGINWTGFDNSGSTYVPFTAQGTLKQAYVDAIVTKVFPKVGRDMDWKQLVTNNEVNWNDQPTNDFGPNGVRETTAINAANQIKARISNFVPQVGMPLMSTNAYAFEQGKLWAQQYGNRDVEVNLGNEVWNVFAGNLGDWNLKQAKAEGYQGDDFRILGLRQGKRLAEHTQAFRDGFAAGGGDPNKVVMVIEGFAPITQYTQNQIDGMAMAGKTPKQYNARISIAQYAAGSASDLQGPLGTAAEKEASLKNFIDTLAGWTAQHKSLALANQLVPQIDAYEMRLGQKPVSSQSEMSDWINFQLSDNEARVQDYGIRKLLDSGGGILNIEGYYGFPWEVNQGQFPLIDYNDSMFANPNQSGAYRGVAGLIDFPEPGVLLWTLLIPFLLRRSRAASSRY